MWAVFRYKKGEYNLLINNLKIKVGKSIKFYNPKIQYLKNFKNKTTIIEKYILSNYAFCWYDKFNDKNFILKLNYIKGLEYFLEGYFSEQKQISDFINYCKLNENKNGNLKQSFFNNLKMEKVKFLNGLFANMVFEVIEKEKNRVKVLLSGTSLVVSGNSSNNIYSSIY